MLLALLGCAPEPYVAAMAACEGDPPVAYLGMDAVTPSDGCVEAMRDSADWSSLEPDHQVRVEAAVYTVLLADAGTFGELQSSLTPAETALRKQVDDLGKRWHLTGEAPASRFWYNWFSADVRDFSEPADEREVGAYYDDGTVEVYWPNLTSGRDVILSSLLVHEASHKVTPPHNSDGGDDGPDGSYGVQAHWLDSWWDAQIDRTDLARCWHVRTYARDICTHWITDPGDLESCLDLRERYDCIEGD